MQIIIISSNGKNHRHWHFSYLHAFVMLLVVLIFVGLMLNSHNLTSDKLMPNDLSLPSLISQNRHDEITPSFLGKHEVEVTNEEYEFKVNEIELFYAQRIGQLQAESIRLNGLIAKLASFSGVDISEFGDLSKPSGQGGVASTDGLLQAQDFTTELGMIEQLFSQQSEQLLTLERYFLTEDSIASAIPEGSPIKEGFIPSMYGKRRDPFDGKVAFHYGLDFAGKAGSQVLSVADGIVSWIGSQNGYGQMLDINHGNGYVTRYAHNQAILVNVGDKVTKGQAIALVGSTGRSTGPHIHFEIIKNGQNVNPYKYVTR